MTFLQRIDTLCARRRRRGTELRIAIVIERFVQDGGGVENVAWQVAHGLVRAGEDVTVIAREAARTSTRRATVPASRPEDEPEEAAQPSVQRVVVPRFWQPLRVIAFSRATARRTRLAIPAFDVVHSFSRTRHQDLYRAGGGSHADFLERTHPGARGRLRGLSPRHRTLLAVERRVFGDPTQRIQCASSLVARRLIEHHGVAPERILLLPNGVDRARFACETARTAGQALRRHEDQDRSPVWLFPASGWQRKGLDRLLAAMACDPGRALRVWVAGRDAPAAWQRRAMHLGVADRIRFLGSRADLPVLYHAVDGMVLPTRYDPFANVTLEAAAAGLPIVTTRANGAAEWLADGCRILENEDDPVELARTLAALADPVERATLGARAAQQAQALDWTSHLDALRAEYRRIVAARHGRGPKP